MFRVLFVATMTPVSAMLVANAKGVQVSGCENLGSWGEGRGDMWEGESIDGQPFDWGESSSTLYTWRLKCANGAGGALRSSGDDVPVQH